MSGPDVSAEYAKNECVVFAKENETRIPWRDIRVMDHWVKKGKRVVELGYFDSPRDKSYTARICVVGDGRIQIVSAFENWMWRE
jgi:hypothetical protein